MKLSKLAHQLTKKAKRFSSSSDGVKAQQQLLQQEDEQLLPFAFSLPETKEYSFIEKDPQYFLRLCQKMKWKYIQRSCHLFLNACNTSSDLKQTVQQQLLQTDTWGNTPLHVICYYKPKVSIVKAILRIISRSSLNLCATTNSKGETPLIIACKSGAGQKTIRVLISSGSDVTMCDDRGISAFQGLLNRYMTIQRVPALRTRYVALQDLTESDLLIARTQNDDVDSSAATSSSFASSSGRSRSRCNNSFIPADEHDFAVDEGEEMSISDFLFSEQENGVNASQKHIPVFALFWSIMEDMIHEAWKQQSQFQHQHRLSCKDYILHGAALVADALPKDLIDMILRIHHVRDGVSASSSSAIVVQPLHMMFSRRIGSQHPKQREHHAYMVQKLMENHSSPSTIVQSAMPWTRRTIFCQAIASGNSWNLLDIKLVGRSNDRSSRQQEGPIQVLLRRCPDLIVQHDKETGLLPFMLAATTAATNTAGKIEQSDDGDDEDNLDRLTLDTIYNLLRAAPEAISSTRR